MNFKNYPFLSFHECNIFSHLTEDLFIIFLKIQFLALYLLPLSSFSYLLSILALVFIVEIFS